MSWSRRADGPSGAVPAVPVRATLRRLILVFVVLTMLGATARATILILVNQRIDTLVSRLDPLAARNAETLQAMTDAETGLLGYQLTGQKLFLVPYDQGKANFTRTIAVAERLAGSDATGKRLLAVEDSAARRWLSEFAAPLLSDPKGTSAENIDTVAARGKALFDRFLLASSAVEVYTASATANARSDIRRIELEGFFALSLIVLVTLAAVKAYGIQLDRALTRPLEGLAATLGRLTAGNRGERAIEAGTSEVQAVARAVNALAQESERIALEQEELDQIQVISTNIARHVNAHLDLGMVLSESVEAIGTALRVDRAFVRLLVDGALGDAVAEWHAADQGPIDYEVNSPPDALARFLAEVAKGAGAFVADDLDTPIIAEKPEIVDHLRRMDIRATIICPLRAGTDLVGSLVLLQIGRERHWTPMEVALVETVAADLARSVLHGQVYERQVQLVARLQELDKSKSDFVATVSHELRTPLTSISGYVELLSDGEAGPMSDEQLGMLAIVDRNASRLRCLIEDLLLLSRIEEGAFRVRLSPFSLSEIISAACAAVAPGATRKGLSFDVEIGGGDVEVQADASQLERALLNLLSNAVKFTPEGGAVTVTCRRSVDHVAVAVSDSGIGIPVEEQERLFQRFFRASNAVDQAIPGTGLGLAIVRSIIEHHHGSLEMTSVAGSGTTFTVLLPLLRVPLNAGTGGSGGAGGVGP